MLAPPEMGAVFAQGQSISLGWKESQTARKNLNFGMMSSCESSTVTKLLETEGVQRWKAPQARNLNFGKGSPTREFNCSGQGNT